MDIIKGCIAEGRNKHEQCDRAHLTITFPNKFIAEVTTMMVKSSALVLCLAHETERTTLRTELVQAAFAQ